MSQEDSFFFSFVKKFEASKQATIKKIYSSVLNWNMSSPSKFTECNGNSESNSIKKHWNHIIHNWEEKLTPFLLLFWQAQMEGFTKGIKIGPNLEQKAKKGSCYTKDPTKELEERKRFGIAAAAREILKEMLSLPLYMYQKQEHPIFQAWFTSKILKRSMLGQCRRECWGQQPSLHDLLIIWILKNKEQYHENIRKQ